MVRVESLTMSLDGYVAGPDQSLDNPLGIGAADLHQWAFATRTFQQKVLGSPDGETGAEDDIASRGFSNIGAWILGRNMFGPQRGPWPDQAWQGWWGAEPPYHVPVFILTHYPRAPLQMQGGTTFQFVTGGIHQALDLALEAAGSGDVRIGGGAMTIRQYLMAGLIDTMHIAIAPVLLGGGESLFEGISLPDLGYRCDKPVQSGCAAHFTVSKINRISS